MDREPLERRVARALEEAGRVLVTSHPRPDGDAIGSTVAAARALELMGKQVSSVNVDPVPRRYRFLAGAERITAALPAHPVDVTLVLDCSDSRLFPAGFFAREGLGRLVVVDHHKTPGDLGEVVLRDPRAAAVGVLLYRIFGRLGVELDRPICDALFCSIMSDTGSFRYQNTDRETLLVAAELVGQGVDPWHISSHLYEDRTEREVRLLSRLLETLTLSPSGRAACLTATRQLLEQVGCEPQDLEGLINYARGIEGVQVALLLRPHQRGVRVSLRSRGAVDVSRIAAAFGGGGHHNAAGCVVPGAPDVDGLRARLFDEAERAWRETTRS